MLIGNDARALDVLQRLFPSQYQRVVAKVSKATGLLYTFVRPAGDEAGHNWSWAALRVDTGAVVWEVPAGSGTFVNNHYAGLALGPDGAAYLGTLGGFLRLSDGR